MGSSPASLFFETVPAIFDKLSAIDHALPPGQAWFCSGIALN